MEQKIIATTPEDCQLRSWKTYVDNIICLEQHMKTVDPTGCIVFTRENEENNKPFLDAKFTRTDDSSVNSTVYRKKRHSNQYLDFASHHPRHQTLVVRTLRNSVTIPTEERDKKEEMEHRRET